MAIYIEDNLPNIQENGLNTLKDATFGADVSVSGDLTVTGTANLLGGVAGTDSLVVANTNGTTAVSVFGASGLGYAIDITGVFLIALDTTAGDITVEAPASTTVVTIAKGTSAGALVGGTTLANNTGIAAGTNVVVDSSSAGNARVYITYRAA